MKVILVTGPNEQILIRAKSEKAAIAHVVSDLYSARSVKADELVDLMASGLTVTDAVDDVPLEQPVESAEAAE